MPQLDKLSFMTQYLWLTIFFFALYFLVVNFFVISVFKSLKLRNIIYKIWYFFIYKFDYESYHFKNKQIVSGGFSFFYNSIFLKILSNFELLIINLKLNNLILTQNFHNSINNFLFSSAAINNIQKINSIKIDEI